MQSGPRENIDFFPRRDHRRHPGAERHINPTVGRVPVCNLTPESVRAWHASLGADHGRINSHAYALLHAILATAVADGLISANPCTIPRATKSPRRREPTVLTVAEIGHLAEKIEPKRFRALILVAAWCGLRWGRADRTAPQRHW